MASRAPPSATPTSEPPPTDVDVIVIGAGLSGLQAAQRLQAAGVTSCHVLEATDRVGGKTRSVPSKPHGGPGVNDVGAAWINDTMQSEMYKLFQRYGIQGEVQAATGNVVHEVGEGSYVVLPYGETPTTGDGDGEALAGIIAHLNELVSASPLLDPASGPDAETMDAVSFKDYCGKLDPSSAVIGFLADAVTRGLLGVDADEVSALYMINYFKSGTGVMNLLSDLKDGGQYLRARQGMDSVAKGLASELKDGTLHLNSPVKSVHQVSPNQCIVRTVNGATYQCRKVVVSIPSPLLRHISFTPPLPEPRQTLSQQTKLGYWSKVIYVFAQPWWRDAGFSGNFQSMIGPASFSRDTSVPDDEQWSISCFLLGSVGAEWSKLSAEERRGKMWAQFAAVFENAVESVPEPTNTIEMEWTKEAFFEGAPTPVVGPGVGMTRSVEELSRPFGDAHFVGTETSDVWKGYMEGAVRSGQRGASEVLEGLLQ